MINLFLIITKGNWQIFIEKKEVLLHAKGQLDLYKNAAITKKKEIVKRKKKRNNF